MKQKKLEGTALVSVIILSVIILAAIFAPLLTKYSFDQQNIEMRLSTPNAQYWFGTDALGRDIFSRVLYGARVSMMVGIVTALISLFVGTLYGALSGYLGGKIDVLMMRIVDVFYVIPALLVAIFLMVVVGQGVHGIIIALSLVGWVNQARLVRGQVLQIKELQHVEAARAYGASGFRLVFKHILPLVAGPAIVALTFQIPSNIMAESFLSFLGIGIQPPQASWGTLASEGFRGMRSYPHLILFPGAVLFITMLAFQFLGDGLRDLLDPRARRNVNT